MPDTTNMHLKCKDRYCKCKKKGRQVKIYCASANHNKAVLTMLIWSKVDYKVDNNTSYKILHNNDGSSLKSMK